MEDSDDPAIGPAAPRRRKRLRRALIGASGLVVVLLIAAWLERKPIASGFIDRSLRDKGVPARFRIADLGLGRQRLTNVVIGDPAHPDLVADWIETGTAIRLDGVRLSAVRAGHVRLRGRLVDGKLSLGSIDRLLPPPSNQPFALPRFDADVADARMRLETPQGVIGLKLAGKGRLDNGFTGSLALVSDRLMLGGCAAKRTTAALRLRIDRAAPIVGGPVRLGALNCGGTAISGAGADVSASLSPALDHWSGRARVAIAAVAQPDIKLQAIAGPVSFDGSAAGTTGRIDLASGAVTGSGVSAARTALTGSYQIANGGARFSGNAKAGGARVGEAMLRRVAAYATSAEGTPLAPIARRLAAAVAGAGRSFDGDADLAIRIGDRGGIVVTRAVAAAASGARLAFAGAGLSYGFASGRSLVDGTLTIGGGGLPEGRVALAQSTIGAPVKGTATFDAYIAPGASLALAPVTFTAARGGTRVTTRIILSGPLGDGRIERLTLPVAAQWDGRTRLSINPGCAPLTFERLKLSSLGLRPARLTLCPLGGALVSVNAGRVDGGARIAGAHLTGAIGSSPLTLAAAGIEARLGQPGFAASGVAVRIGQPDLVTRLDIARLDGRVANGALGGTFAGAAGRIGAVPLLLSDATGDWRLQNGALALTGALMVADTAAPARFQPLAGRDVALTLADGTIHASGALVEPKKNVRVATVDIVHNLSRGTGHADLAVAGITFGDGFQPIDLTPLTLGIVADVKGTVAGEGHIRWNDGGVTSDGKFTTANLDLAAALGPVSGISGTIRFTDLLALESAPGQVVTIKSINPGVPVNDGTIRYQTLAGSRIRIEEGRWPFAGGSLVLEPALLDFAEAQERRMTFRITGLDAAQFLQQFDFKNLNATGTFDGVLPMVFDTSGGRIENGRLAARQRGGTIAYVGDLTEKDLGFWGNMAFQTLKSLTYKNVDIVMNGPLAGEMVTEVRFAGVGQGVGAKRNFLVSRLAKLPFVFNVRIKAPFRGLIDSAQSLYDPKRILDQQRDLLLPLVPATPPQPIQPPESRKMP